MYSVYIPNALFIVVHLQMVCSKHGRDYQQKMRRVVTDLQMKAATDCVGDQMTNACYDPSSVSSFATGILCPLYVAVPLSSTTFLPSTIYSLPTP